jgi:hypothetical protein
MVPIRVRFTKPKLGLRYRYPLNVLEIFSGTINQAIKLYSYRKFRN